MDDQAYLRMEEFVRELGANIGISDLGDAAIVERSRLDEGALKSLSGKERLLARLEALERHILLRHVKVHDLAMDTIRQVLIGSAPYEKAPGQVSFPDGAYVEFTRAGSREPARLPLADLPNMAPPLRKLRLLIGRIREDLDVSPR